MFVLQHRNTDPSTLSARVVSETNTNPFAKAGLMLRNGVNAPGMPPTAYPRLLGRRAARDIAADAPITAAMVEDGAELA